MVNTQPQNCAKTCQWRTVGHSESYPSSVNMTVIWAWQDDDSSFHVDFVVAATDLRCQNYRILPPVNRARVTPLAWK